MKAHLCILLVLLQLASSRPIFERDVFATADEDGLFRSQSLKRSQGIFNLQYTAKIAQGVVSLDKDQAIEEIRCDADMLHIKTTEPRNWNNGDVLAGGAEWGCRNDAGESVIIAFRVSKVHKAGGVYRVSGSTVPGESLFEHLDLTFERAEQHQLASRQVAAAITFPNFPSTIVPGKPTRISFAIDTARIAGDQDITVGWFQRQDNTTVTAATTIATIKGSVGSFDWTAPDVANPAVASFFNLSQGANVVESPAFFVEKVLPALTWNTNPDKTSKEPDMVIWNSTCATAAYCKNVNMCPSCTYPNRVSYLSFNCRNCTASFSSTIHKFSIKTTADNVTDFTFNATVDFASSLDWQFNSNFEWVGQIQKRVFSANLLTIPPFTVGGLSVNLGLFLDIDITADVRAPKAVMNGSIFTRTGASYDIAYDKNAPVSVTLRPYYKRPHSPLYGDAPYLAWFDFIPTVRLAVQNNMRALAVAVDQYLYADYRFANPLPPMKTEFPLPNGDWKWSAEICKEPHRQEQWEWTGTDYSAEVNLGPKQNVTVKNPMHDFASGCDWLIELGDHIYITPTQAAIDKVAGPVWVEVRKEVGLCLGMTDANMFLENNGNEYRISFLSNEHGFSDKLAAQYGDKNSMVYKQALLKDSTYRLEGSSMVVLPSLLIVLIMLLF